MIIMMMVAVCLRHHAFSGRTDGQSVVDVTRLVRQVRTPRVPTLQCSCQCALSIDVCVLCVV